jgi:hypothetical protein
MPPPSSVLAADSLAEIAPNIASLDLPMLTWLLSFLLLSAAAPCEATVCRCRPMPHEEAAARADVIFTATVVSVDERKGDSGAPRFGHEARMRVHASWKGVDTPEVVAVGGGTSCDFIYRPGDRYLIYGQVDSSGAIHATYCTGSRRTEPGAESVEPLGEPLRTWSKSAASGPR